MSRPPRLAEWWLALWVWPDEREAVLGDFDEEFAERLRDGGRLGAACWYWRESLRLTWGLRASESGERWSRRSLMAFDDVRQAVRRLRRQPIGAAVSVVALALAIASATVAWSVVQAVLMAPLPVRDPATIALAEVEYGSDDRTWTDDTFAYPTYRALRAAGVFEGLTRVLRDD